MDLVLPLIPWYPRLVNMRLESQKEAANNTLKKNGSQNEQVRGDGDKAVIKISQIYGALEALVHFSFFAPQIFYRT